jgi:Tol biopolymer transport system component
MPQHNPKNIRARQFAKFSRFLLMLIVFLPSCVNPGEMANGIVFVSTRGSNPTVQSISWSPIDENKVLIRAYETPMQPAEVFILDIQTGKKEFVVGPLKPAQLIEAKWMPDGKTALILAVDTIGFEPSGWWAVNTENKSAEYLLSPMDAVAWSPNGKYIAAIHRKPGNNSSLIELKLIDANTKAEEVIADYIDMDYSGGISWSPDGQFVVFSLGKFQGSNSLFILNMETRQVKTISENDKSEQPSWSPKGNIIAFENNEHLYLISPEGKCEVEIPNLENAWSPTWSPDGKRLGYISGDGIYYVEVAKVLGRDVYESLCE